jgi:hypothetical protein
MSDQQPQKPPSGQGQPKRIAIDLPKDLSASYANLVFISHTPAEMVLDFAQVLPRTAKGTVVSRIVMSPMHAKLLHRALGQNIANFEGRFGEIAFPRTLADELFDFSSPASSGEDEEEGEGDE